MSAEVDALVAAAAAPYRAAGRHAFHFARGKLRGDPVFLALLRQELLPAQGRLVDLGCGQGLLLSLLHAARARFAAGQWPAHWPPPPALALHGLELDPKRVQWARLALGQAASVESADLRTTSLPACNVITLFDVLFYLAPADQCQVLENCAGALAPGGLLLLREADAGKGLSFMLTRWAERLMCWTRGQFRQPLAYRRREDWLALLSKQGFTVSMHPMNEGTPFSNMLFIARRR